jgi:hypothetical protein
MLQFVAVRPSHPWIALDAAAAPSPVDVMLLLVLTIVQLVDVRFYEGKGGKEKSLKQLCDLLPTCLE